MGQDVQLSAEKREALGKNAVAKLRTKGKVPVVAQEHGKDSSSLSVDGGELMKAYLAVGKSQPIDLKIGNVTKLVLIKEATFIPLKSEFEHVVFQVPKQDEVVDAEVPIQLVGEAPAIENRLIIFNTLESVMIRALPRNLPEVLEVSTTDLAEINDKVLVSDIKLPEGVELVEVLTNVDDEEKREEFLNQPIAIVKEPSVVESDEGVELAEGESEADAVEAENGGETEESQASEGSEGGSE